MWTQKEESPFIYFKITKGKTGIMKCEHKKRNPLYILLA